MIVTTSFALLALSSLPAAVCAPTFLGPLDHDFVSTLVPVVAASAPAFSDMLAFTHRVGEGLYNRDVDPAEAWVNDPEFANSAMNASTPATYDLVYQNLHAATQVPSSYLTVLALTTYDPSQCATACTSNKDCTSFNLYIERTPSSPPSESSRSPPAVTKIFCALYTGILDASTATNDGQFQLDFHIVIAGSNGYVSSTAHIVPTGFQRPEPFGAAAIVAPEPCADSYLGLRTFTATGGGENNVTAVRRCAAACAAQNSSGSSNNNGTTQEASPASPPTIRAAAVEPRTPSSCTFFNTYMLYNNTASMGMWQCAMYADAWAGTHATNRGQFRGSDQISIGESWGYRRVDAVERSGEQCPPSAAR